MHVNITRASLYAGGAHTGGAQSDGEHFASFPHEAALRLPGETRLGDDAMRESVCARERERERERELESNAFKTKREKVV